MPSSNEFDGLPLAEIKLAAEGGEPEAQFALANRLIQKFASKGGSLSDAACAAQWYRKAATQGHAKAQYRLGLACDKGEGTKQDPTEAFSWYLQAADQGNAWAQFRVGLCFRSGQGVPQNRFAAEWWLQKSGEQGLPDARAALSAVRSEIPAVLAEFPVQPVPKKAELVAPIFVEYSPMDTDGGVPGPEIELESGEMSPIAITNGQKVPEKEVNNWRSKPQAKLKADADNGNATAQYQLGKCYDNGEGVNRDVVQAVIWYRLAAEQGNAKAQANLGDCYEKGEGVAQDYSEAFKWFSLACANGNESAGKNLIVVENCMSPEQLAAGKCALGGAYSKGIGVLQDLERAKQLTGEAVTLGHKAPQTVLSKTDFDKDSADKTLLESQQKNSPLGREVLPSHGSRKSFLTIAAVTAGIIMVILTKGNILHAVLIGVVFLAGIGLIWGAGEAIAEWWLGYQPGKGEVFFVVCILVCCLFFLKGCNGNAPVDYDPSDSILRP